MNEPFESESHLSEARLLEMACEPERRATRKEEAHLENCSRCFRKLVELVTNLEEN